MANREPFDTLTLITLIVTFILIIILNTYRLYHHYYRGDKWKRLHYWMAASLVFITIRFIFICITTVNLTVIFNEKTYPLASMPEDEQEARVLGAKTVLLGRAGYALFMWAMKFCVLYWLEAVIGREKKWGMIFDTTFWIFIVMLVTVLVTTFLECIPTRLYWQLPPKTACTNAQIQLLTMGITNILSDITLIFLPLPILLRLSLPLFQKLQLATLFSVSIFVIIITVIRMPIIISSNSVQKLRTFWACIECLAAALVANAPMFNNLIHEYRAKCDINNSLGGRGRRDSGIPASLANVGRLDKFGPPKHKRSLIMAATTGVGYGDRGRGPANRAPVTGQDSVGSLTRNEIDMGSEKVWETTRRSVKLEPESKQKSWGVQLMPLKGGDEELGQKSAAPGRGVEVNNWDVELQQLEAELGREKRYTLVENPEWGVVNTSGDFWRMGAGGQENGGGGRGGGGGGGGGGGDGGEGGGGTGSKAPVSMPASARSASSSNWVQTLPPTAQVSGRWLGPA